MKINGMAGTTIQVRDQNSGLRGWVLEIDISDGISTRTIYLNEAQAKTFSREYAHKLVSIQDMNARMGING